MALSKYRQRGLALETLFFLFGISLAISVPAYNDYAKRSRAMEGLVLASAPKVSIAEYWEAHKKFPEGDTKEIHNTLGIVMPEKINGKGFDRVTVESGGRIRISLNESVYAGGALLLEPEPDAQAGFLYWRCRAEPDERAFLKLVPLECRKK